MAEKPIAEEKRAFMTGNEVVAWAALAAQVPVMAAVKAFSKTKRLLLVESSEGQLQKILQSEIYNKVTLPIETLLKPGVGVTSEEIVEKVKGLFKA